MDSQLNALDPKLREAYERIMGTNTKSTVQTAQADTPAIPPTDTQQTPPAPLAASAPTPPPSAAPVIHHEQPTVPETVQHTETIQVQQPEKQNEHTNEAPQPQFSTPPTAQHNNKADMQMHAYVAQEVAGVKQSLQLIQVVYVVGGIVFFVVYALFWMNFFNVASPF